MRRADFIAATQAFLPGRWTLDVHGETWVHHRALGGAWIFAVRFGRGSSLDRIRRDYPELRFPGAAPWRAKAMRDADATVLVALGWRVDGTQGGVSFRVRELLPEHAATLTEAARGYARIHSFLPEVARAASGAADAIECLISTPTKTT